MRPRVAPENRPSVTSATDSPRPWPTSAAVTASISRNPRPAARPLVAHDDDVPGDDPSRLDRGERGLLAVEDARRPAVPAAPVPGDLHDGALGREAPLEDDEAAGGRERCRERPDDLLAGGLAGLERLLADRRARDGRLVGPKEPALEEPPREEPRPPRALHVRRDEAPAGLEVAQQRRAAAHRAEVVEREGDARLARDREEVEDPVRRPAARRDRGDRVLERAASEDLPPLLHVRGEVAEVHVAGRDLDPGVRDPDERAG
jgi:hypothetical protein